MIVLLVMVYVLVIANTYVTILFYVNISVIIINVQVIIFINYGDVNAYEVLVIFMQQLLFY